MALSSLPWGILVLKFEGCAALVGPPVLRGEGQRERGVDGNYFQHLHDQRKPKFGGQRRRAGPCTRAGWPSGLVGKGPTRGAARPRAGWINSPLRMHAPQAECAHIRLQAAPVAELSGRRLAALNSPTQTKRPDNSERRPRAAGERQQHGAGSVVLEPARRRCWRDGRRRHRRLAARARQRTAGLGPLPPGTPFDPAPRLLRTPIWSV